MWECSGNQSDSKPVSSAARAVSTGPREVSVGKMKRPKSTQETVDEGRKTEDGGRSGIGEGCDQLAAPVTADCSNPGLQPSYYQLLIRMRAS